MGPCTAASNARSTRSQVEQINLSPKVSVTFYMAGGAQLTVEENGMSLSPTASGRKYALSCACCAAWGVLQGVSYVAFMPEADASQPLTSSGTGPRTSCHCCPARVALPAGSAQGTQAARAWGL